MAAETSPYNDISIREDGHQGENDILIRNDIDTTYNTTRYRDPEQLENEWENMMVKYEITPKNVSPQDKIQAYTKIIEDYKDQPLVMSKAYKNRGEILFSIGRDDEYKLDRISSIILDPNQMNADFNIGSLYLDLRMPEKAIPALKKALVITENRSESILEHKSQCLNYLAAALMD